MCDTRKTDTLDLRVRFRFSRLIDPELFLVLSNLNEADRSSLMHAMITRSAIGIAMPLNGLAQSLQPGSGGTTTQLADAVTNDPPEESALLAGEGLETRADAPAEASDPSPPPNDAQTQQSATNRKGALGRVWIALVGKQTKTLGMFLNEQ